jgi:hypothetical protein
MFTNDTVEAKNNRVTFSEMYYPTLKAFVDYIYYIEDENLKDLALPLLFVAEQYNMADLKNLCQYHLSKSFNVENLIEILIAAHTYDFIDPILKGLSKTFLK